jgi:hypothetical protein
MQFQKDNQYSRNGKQGRPKGSRNFVTKQLIDAYWEAFEKYGKACLEIIAKEEPATFLKLGYGALIPRQFDIEAVAVAALTDEQLDQVLEHIEQQQAKLIEHRPGELAASLAPREVEKAGSEG